MRDQSCWDKTWRRPIGRRGFVHGLLLGSAGLALGATIGCENKTATGGAGTPASGGQTTASPSGQATPQPVRGGTLIVVQPNDIMAKNLAHAVNPPNYYLLPNVYERLTHYKIEKLEAEPELAESWKFAPDYTSLTVKLRQGVKFHTGRPLTAEDVKWNLEWVAKPEAASQLMNVAKGVVKIDIPDPYTLNLQFDQPRPSFLDAFEALFIADPQTFQEAQDGKRYVGTGPFVFKEWVPGDHFTLTRNPDYWQKGLPYLDEITMKVIPDAQTRLVNLQTGAADIAVTLDPRDLKDLQKDKNFFVTSHPIMTSVWYVGIDVKAEPFTDKRVRQAIAYLLDRRRIVDTQLLFGEPTVIPWDKLSPAYDAELAQRNQYNPAKAKELLTQAGLAGGATVSLYPSGSYPETGPIVEMLQAELTKLGWKTSIEKLASAEMIQKLNTGQFRGLWCSLVGYMHMTPSTLFINSYPFRVPNGSNFDTPQYRQLINDIVKETDEAKLKTIYRQINEVIVDECFLCPVASVERPLAVSAKVKGLKLSRSGMPIQYGIWKSK